MSQEILYTSAPQGLKPGARGFCTVVSSEGISKALAERLESLSGYRHAFLPPDPRTAQNPINYSHLVLSVAGRKYHVLSRVSDYGLDYTNRTNKLAHHVALDEMEIGLCAQGPAELLAEPGLLEAAWDGKTDPHCPERPIPSSEARSHRCDYWRQLAGDAGWGGVLAEHALANRQRPVSVIFAPGMDTLRLLIEAMSLLPSQQRWEVTCSTYYTKLPAGVDCMWRFLLDGSPEAQAARRNSPFPLIDLCTSLGPPKDSDAVDAAREGRFVAMPSQRTLASSPLPDVPIRQAEATVRPPRPPRPSSRSPRPKVPGTDNHGADSYGADSYGAYGAARMPTGSGRVLLWVSHGIVFLLGILVALGLVGLFGKRPSEVPSSAQRAPWASEGPRQGGSNVFQEKTSGPLQSTLLPAPEQGPKEARSTWSSKEEGRAAMESPSKTPEDSRSNSAASKEPAEATTPTKPPQAVRVDLPRATPKIDQPASGKPSGSPSEKPAARRQPPGLSEIARKGESRQRLLQEPEAFLVNVSKPGSSVILCSNWKSSSPTEDLRFEVRLLGLDAYEVDQPVEGVAISQPASVAILSKAQSSQDNAYRPRIHVNVRLTLDGSELRATIRLESPTESIPPVGIEIPEGLLYMPLDLNETEKLRKQYSAEEKRCQQNSDKRAEGTARAKDKKLAPAEQLRVKENYEKWEKRKASAVAAGKWCNEMDELLKHLQKSGRLHVRVYAIAEDGGANSPLELVRTKGFPPAERKPEKGS